MRARHYAAPAPVVRERQRIEGRLRPSARDMFPGLRDRLLASRPIVGEIDGAPIFGKPTFRNVIEGGVHV